MIFFCIFGAILFYCFVYLLLTHYAYGVTFITISIKGLQSQRVRLSPNEAFTALELLLVAIVIYVTLDYAISLVRQRRRADSSDAESNSLR